MGSHVRNVVFFVNLIATFYLCEDDSNRQSEFDQLKISYYDHQYVKELEW